MTVQEDRNKQWTAEDGTWLLTADLVSGELYVPENFVDKKHVAEFAEAVQAARHELESARD